MKGVEVERGDEVEDLTGGGVARKAKLISLRGERGAFVNCKPAKVYYSRCENSHQFLRLDWKESASEYVSAEI